MEITPAVFTFFHRFIEYGEYKNNYYGTSLDSVRSVLAKNKVCLLDVQPHVSKHAFWMLVVPHIGGFLGFQEKKLFLKRCILFHAE